MGSVRKKSKYTRNQVIEKIKKGESLEGVDLSWINLSELEIGINEDTVNLRGANLKYADFTAANLYDFDFSGANLSEVHFDHAFLEEVDLSNAILHNCGLPFARLSTVILYEADLRMANLYNIESSGKANFAKANLNKADLTLASLKGCNFSKANLSEANLSEANLKNANLIGADISGANLSETNLNNAYLIDADISGVNLFQTIAYGWKIKNIKCTHVYQCPDKLSWIDPQKREEFRHNFKRHEDIEDAIRSLLAGMLTGNRPRLQNLKDEARNAPKPASLLQNNNYLSRTVENMDLQLPQVNPDQLLIWEQAFHSGLEKLTVAELKRIHSTVISLKHDKSRNMLDDLQVNLKNGELDQARRIFNKFFQEYQQLTILINQSIGALFFSNIDTKFQEIFLSLQNHSPAPKIKNELIY